MRIKKFGKLTKTERLAIERGSKYMLDDAIEYREGIKDRLKFFEKQLVKSMQPAADIDREIIANFTKMKTQNDLALRQLIIARNFKDELRDLGIVQAVQDE
jgi:hypothetical protein